MIKLLSGAIVVVVGGVGVVVVVVVVVMEAEDIIHYVVSKRRLYCESESKVREERAKKSTDPNLFNPQTKVQQIKKS